MRQWYGAATGSLGWSPKTFWKATLGEFFMALDGRREVHRTGPAPMTRAELDALIADNPPTRSIRKGKPKRGNDRR